MYRVSHFGWNHRVSPLLVKLEGCGLHKPVPLFCQTEDAVNKIFIALFVSELQGLFENFVIWDSSGISVTVDDIEKVKTDSCRTFYVEYSGVVCFSMEKIFLKIWTKVMFFQMEHPVYL